MFFINLVGMAAKKGGFSSFDKTVAGVVILFGVLFAGRFVGDTVEVLLLLVFIAVGVKILFGSLKKAPPKKKA